MKPELDCSQFEQRVNDILDQRLKLNDCPQLRKHAQHCLDCQQLLDQYDQVAEVFVVPVSLGSTFDFQQIKSLKHSEAMHRNHGLGTQKLAWTVAPCFAALLMVAIGMWFAPLQAERDYEFAWSLPNDTPNHLAGYDSALGKEIGDDRLVAKQQYGNDLPSLATTNLKFSNLDLVFEIDKRYRDSQNQPPRNLSRWNNVLLNYFENGLLNGDYAIDSSRLPGSFVWSPSLAAPELHTFYLDRIDPWQAVIRQTPDILGLNVAHQSLRLTLGWLEKSLLKPTDCEIESEPDLGIFVEPRLTSMA